MKTILITGSTDGIGKLTAIKLAKDGHKLYVHGRNPEKLQNVITEIKQETNNQNIEGFVADFSNMDDVKNMANKISRKLEYLDVLINNAGIFKSPIAVTKDGYDIRFAVNYFAPYILTNVLIPLFNKSENPRIINLSSAAQDTINYDILNGNLSQDQDRNTYGQSKLAILMWSFYFAEQHKDITTIAVNPGSLLNTKMVAEAYGRHLSSADKGANILYDLTILEQYKNHSGEYFDNDLGEEKGMFSQAHPDTYKQGLISGLIKKTEELLKLL